MGGSQVWTGWDSHGRNYNKMPLRPATSLEICESHGDVVSSVPSPKGRILLAHAVQAATMLPWTSGVVSVTPEPERWVWDPSHRQATGMGPAPAPDWRQWQIGISINRSGG